MTKGFHNAFHNHSHDKTVFTSPEKLFKDRFHQVFNGLPLLHEHIVKFNVDTKKRHFWLDFLIPTLRKSVEINPAWHEVYEPVVERDKVKKRLLAQRQHIEQIDVRVGGKRVKGKWKPELNEKDVQKCFEILSKTEISPETLDYYLF